MAINEIKWYFLDKKRSRVEESRFIQGWTNTSDVGQTFGRDADGEQVQEQGNLRVLHQVEGDFGQPAGRMSLLRFHRLISRSYNSEKYYFDVQLQSFDILHSCEK